MTVKKAILPGPDVPVVGQSGLMTPSWYAFFSDLMRRGVLDMPDVDNTTAAIANGQLLIWDTSRGKFKPYP
ncbi:hypothetical protein [Rhodopseudomonas sp. B29]|uniref:hypothetical protein n=1 Tax=Rhodopseudomonas sp. B29 TaxID=95607 RepID=UPI000346CE89|nr:hypothetical protein [Rhodopseudomonas sp. B29]